MDVAEIENSSAPIAAAYSYHHAGSLEEIVEVNSTFTPTNAPEPADDLGASASSVEWNNFERFLDEDRMWGVHRPATRKPFIVSSETAGKNKVIPNLKSDEKDGKEVATGASAAIANAPTGAVHACTSSDPLQSNDIISQRERKLSTDSDVSTKTCQTIETDQSTDPVATTQITTKTECDAQPPTIPEIALTEPTDISSEDTNDSDSALQSDGDIPFAKALPAYSSLYDYAYIDFDREDIRNVWIMTILQRPGYTVEYAKLNCGFWYIFEDKKNVRMMAKHEYDDFVQWISETPKHPDELDHVDETYDEEEDDEEDWPVIPQWKKRYELGRGWGVLKSFNHPDYADRKYTLANDDMWYFEYKGKFRLLMEHELDLLNRRREDGTALVDAAEEGPAPNRWNLDSITEEEEE
ncbi:hypothetical protein QBC45DRAFT_456961 [Copromyces sp. CBS 386.78]|nr:hypothetical protein QBC45DRAFT_456961 [Copromyces sp. CBS 386.78]